MAKIVDWLAASQKSRMNGTHGRMTRRASHALLACGMVSESRKGAKEMTAVANIDFFSRQQHPV
jgi:hypothetical protein